MPAGYSINWLHFWPFLRLDDTGDSVLVLLFNLLPPEAPITATDLFAALVVEKFLVAMAETGFAKRENILAAKVATVTKRSMRTTVLSAVHETIK